MRGKRTNRRNSPFFYHGSVDSWLTMDGSLLSLVRASDNEMSSVCMRAQRDGGPRPLKLKERVKLGQWRQDNDTLTTSHYPSPCASTSTMSKQVIPPAHIVSCRTMICSVQHCCEDCLRWAARAFSSGLRSQVIQLAFFCKLYSELVLGLPTRSSSLDGAIQHVLGFMLEPTSPTSGVAGYAGATMRQGR